MTRIRFNPMWEMQNIAQDMNKFMKNTFASENRPRIEIGSFKPRVDIIEDDKALYFEAEIPGLKKDNVKITVNDERILTLKGEKKFEQNEEQVSCCVNERAFGEFLRSFQLPENVDTDKISANFQDGLLTLTVPKIEQVTAKEKEVIIS